MSGYKGGVRWANGLTAPQRAAVMAIREKAAAGLPLKKVGGGEEWTVFCMPSCAPFSYVELRHYVEPGTVYRWLLEGDGTVGDYVVSTGTRLRCLKPLRSVRAAA